MTEVFPTQRLVNGTPFKRVQHAFEELAGRSPKLCAVMMAGGGVLSYGELNRRADDLAARLREFGIGNEAIAGVCLERSMDAIVAILAVLKAEGAYLPLDPAYPAERTAYMLENARAHVLVTSASIQRDWPPELTVIQPDGSVLSNGSRQAVKTDASCVAVGETPLDPLAYVIYTSGSTGKPKGVAMPHGPLCNLLRWQARTCPLPEGNRVLQFAPLSFDVSFQETFSTLGEGGTLVVIPESLRRDPRALARLMGEQSASRIFLPPVMLAQLAGQFAAGGVLPRGLREVITAGEALKITPAVVRFFKALQERGTPCALYNHYGPTETHVITAYTLEGEPETWPALPPIGRPIDEAKICLLDETGKPSTDGQPGRLFLGGSCLARGYLHNPELTQARFVQIDGSRWYDTGDLAQMLPGGDLQFLGRADDQVKIRGFRIELGEIENVLVRHPAIGEAVVGVVPGTNGTNDELLAGFVLRDPKIAWSPGALREWLADQIPDYMIPARFAALETLPLTPSGKVDRRALPSLVRDRNIGETPRVAAAAAPPRNQMEKVITEIWAEVLDSDRHGVEENFFEIGGNSLHAMQVHTKLCQALRREFSITDLFQHPTIAALARHLSPDNQPASAPTIQDRARRQQQQQAAARVRFAGGSPTRAN